MKRSASISAVAAAVVTAFAVTPYVHAVLAPDLRPCRKAIAASAGRFVYKKMTAIQRCNDRDCTNAELTPTIADLQQRLRDAIARRCANVPQNELGPGFLEYPGPCTDADRNDGFTLADVDECLVTSHENAVDALIDIEDDHANVVDQATGDCQRAIWKSGRTLVRSELKAIQKCRNDIDKGRVTIPGETCATADAMTAGKIANAESKARARIDDGCTTAAVQALGTCTDPACAPLCGTCDPACVAECIVTTHHDAIDHTVATPPDLIDFEYPAPGPSPTPSPTPKCGDQQRNQLEEECDGTDDGGCPGQCGAPASSFPCLCLDVPRERVIEHANTDLDTGWTGASHDTGVVEGGSYFVDLHDCDGPAGPDTVCTLGPSCSGAPHPPCSNDAQCAAFGLGTCRKTRTAVGPHCNLDVQQTCSCTGGANVKSQPTCPDTINCPGGGNFCVQHFHGPPLPITAGGVPVCIVNVFTEDVTGTRDVATGESAYRLRQNSFVPVTGLPSQPCPVCGGFCQGNDRHLCATNADCADTANQICITTPVCSFGPKQDQACRPDPPFGGPTALFGNPSVDCPPPTNGAGTVDILFNPATTGTVSLSPTVQCDEPVFNGKACADGTNNGATCTAASECPGGACAFQCFCPTGGAVHERPNLCDAACVGGANDAQSCADDSECQGGFCHLADCRPDPTAPAALQPNEGGCTVTLDLRCSVTTYRSCVLDADCAPPACPRCQVGETCHAAPRNCFINSEIVRAGTPSPSDPVTASVFCIGPTNIGAVDAVAGLPGPGALRQPTTVIDTGF